MTGGAASRLVAVTGATGLVGRHLCDHFARRGWRVRALSRDPSRYPFREPGIERARCVLPEALDGTALRDADAVIHCAYATRSRDLADARRVNEEGARRVLEAARAAGVARFVFVSSMSARADAASYYGRSKYAIERILDGDRDLIIRLGLVLARGAGLFHRMTETVRRGRVVPLFGGGRQIVQTVHVDDACEAFARAVERGLTGTLTVAEPAGYAMRDFLELVCARMGRRCTFLPLPATPALVALRALESLGAQLPVTSENLLGLLELCYVDTRTDLARLDMTLRSARESLAELG